MIGDDRGDKEIGGCERRDVELESDREHPDKQHKRSEVRGEEQDESCERDVPGNEKAATAAKEGRKKLNQIKKLMIYS